MRTNTMPRVAVLALLLSACAPDASVAPTAPPELGSATAARVSDVVTTTIIPPVPGVGQPTSPYGMATAINEAGVVAGWSRGPTESFAFTWRDGTMTSLGNYFEPVAINRFGEVAGNQATTGAVVWRDGTLTTVTPSGGFASAHDMNDKGQIVGTGRLAGETVNQAFLWEDGTYTKLGTLGGSSSTATSINKHGEVVGFSLIAGNAETHAFLWVRGVMSDLGTLYGGSSSAFAINDHGEIAGLTDRPFSAGDTPFIWRKGVMTQMLSGPAPPDPALSALYVISGISNAGHVVGTRTISSRDPRAFVWRDGVDVDLPGRPTFAMSVNSFGEIAGYEAPIFGWPGALLWTVGRHGP